ncbi:MAG TPA: Rab family GTPase [Candidatus Lokiarchaeia archaeon]|nr:Rab family GTPase [Candidatus Lokiarchaeia archaeon]
MGKNFVWKICVLGDGSVGKTSLVTYYTQRSFKEFYLPTIGANFSIKEVDLDDKSHVKAYIWDIAGQTKFASIRKMFYEKAVASIFVFDVTNRKSFDGIDAWKADLVESLGAEFPCALVANKTDLEDTRVISSEEGFEKASDLGMSYFETSAKTGVGVDDAFMNLFLLILDRIK